MKSNLLIIGSGFLIFVACSEKQPHDQPIVEHEAVAEVATESMGIPRTASADGASVFFITPTSGAIVSNPIVIEFGITGMDIVKAGTEQENSGHHHLLIDTELPAMGMPIPADDHHIHFGDGSDSTEISLEPGEHTVQMLLGDYLHIPHNPPLSSAQITIIVK
tara:strand:+ start:1689 stop:2177 length:489 start_codon:yes stop_codon:yes gene_type:complete